jgi:hypothetical protein
MLTSKAVGSGDFALCAQLYSWQSDAYMGLAGLAGADKGGLTPDALRLVDKAGNRVDLAIASELFLISPVSLTVQCTCG